MALCVAGQVLKGTLLFCYCCRHLERKQLSIKYGCMQPSEADIGIVLLLIIIINKMMINRGLVNYQKFLTGLFTTWSKWKGEVEVGWGEKVQGADIRWLPPHTRHFVAPQPCKG